MLLNDYMNLAIRTAKIGSERDNLLHAALGITGEAGEFADAVKRYTVYGAELNRENAIEELGDALWYIALGAKTLGVTMEDLATYNIAKLQKRYPDQYSDHAATLRADKAA